MGFGLFGKLPQKRDFVSVNLPNSVLNPFETWLQSCVAASRNDIGRDWERYYLVAPIWHFWLGPEVLGTACAGALMPSVDQVGRYFPLSIIYCAEKDEVLLPPLLAPLEDWYRHLDERLLAVLGEQREFEVAAVLSGLVPPVFDGAMAELTLVAPGYHAMSGEAPVAAPDPVPDAAEGEEPAASATAVDETPEESPDAAAAPEAAEAAAEPEPGAPASASSPWDDDGAEAPAEPAPAPAAAMPAISAWDDLPDLDAKEFGLPPITGSNIRDVPPSGMTIPPETSRPAAAPAVNPAPAPEAAPEPEAEASPVVAAEPAAPRSGFPAPQVYSDLFKGGIDMRIEPGRTMAEALGGLMALDYQHAAAGRTYWFCAAPANGYAAFFARQGMPDPYYFSRMLQWMGQSPGK